jgi:hypothetical protein
VCYKSAVVPTLPAREERSLAHTLRQLARKIDAFQERLGQGVSWIMLAMVLVVFFDVVLRYAFSKSTVWLQELEWHLFGVVYDRTGLRPQATTAFQEAQLLLDGGRSAEPAATPR